MKAILLIVVFLMSFSSVHAQTLRKDGDRYELTYVSSDAGEAHKSGNAFAAQVGKILKSSYPSKVLDPAVDLKVFKVHGQEQFRLTWSCRVMKTAQAYADYYFDRRGTLLHGATSSEAERKVQAEIGSSAKVEKLRRALKNAKIPRSFIRDSFSGSSTEGYWYIQEFFVVAPK